MDKNPYGGGPGSGISMPPYYRPTPSVKNRNNFFPQTEEFTPPDQIRPWIREWPTDIKIDPKALLGQ